ncbi:MAG: ribbon-helix-helix protein, CopG family [Bacillota bacterium]|nr:ribbon-helix-helix protein, CopG family [Bacillota bacterium]
MERTQIYLTAEQKTALEEIARLKSVPMADVVREAVSEYLARKTADHRLQVLDGTFGAVPEWKGVDSIEHVRRLRSGWEERRDRLAGGVAHNGRDRE